ncbi:MAG: murein biosynthesis integral membrane protein MurJ [Micromonosporaceae bacterium]
MSGSGPVGRNVAGWIAAAAALIAGLTVLSRVTGFARTLVFAGAVGSTDLGDIYQTANTVPNILFEIAAGGALASLVVPLLAGAVAAGERGRVGELASALLTWTLTLLVPLALLLAFVAEPVVALLANHAAPDAVAVGARMLRIFAVQVPLYGVGIVLTGVLHAHHRFAWPVLAPLLSSLTVVGAYLLFAAVDGAGTPVASVSRAGELILAVGTTLGVAVLALCLLVPLRPLGLRFRPRYAIEPGLRRRAVGLAGAAVVTVVAQQLTLAYLIYLANGSAQAGSLVIFTLAQTVFLLPWAVLAVPLSTPTFPALAQAQSAGEHERFDATLSRVTRAVVLCAGFGTAALIGLAVPAGHLLSVVTATRPSPVIIAAAVLAFAPGLIGYSLFALLSRALYAAGETRRAAVTVAAGWAVTALAALVLAATVPAAQRVSALAAANSIGMSVLGGALLVVVWRRRGAAAVAGVVRALLVTVLAAGLAGGLGWLVGGAVSAGTPGAGRAVLAGMLAGVVVTVCFLGVSLGLDRGDVRAVWAAVRRRRSRIGRGVGSRAGP